MYKMIVFDCDGTLVDSSIMIDYLYEGYSKMFKDQYIDRNDFIPCFFMTTEEIYDYLKIPVSLRSEFEELCFGKYGAKMYDMHLFDGIEECIKELYERGYLLAINTSRNRADMRELEKPFKNINRYFDKEFVVTSDDICHPKPDPESLIYLLKKSNLKNNELLFIGDGVSDHECAKRANVDFVYAKWGSVTNIDLKPKYVLDNPSSILSII